MRKSIAFGSTVKFVALWRIVRAEPLVHICNMAVDS
jgi:hypothetical protein